MTTKIKLESCLEQLSEHNIQRVFFQRKENFKLTKYLNSVKKWRLESEVKIVQVKYKIVRQ